MSSRPWAAPHFANTARICSSDWTSHGSTNVDPIDAASGRTRFSIRLSTELKPTVAPSSWNARAMPQAIEWSLATPKISACLPVEQSHRSSLADGYPVLGRPRRPARVDPDRPATPDDLGSGPGRRPRASCSTSTASSSSRARCCPEPDEALADLEARAIPYRIVTNTSLISRQSLSRWGDRLGAPIPAVPDHERAVGQRRLHPSSLPGRAAVRHRLDRRADRVRRPASAERRRRPTAPDARAAAVVVVGDAPEAVTYDNLNRAFRLVRSGAELIGMHRNPWWLTPDGPTHRLGGARHRAGVRDRALRPDPRQAVGGLLPRGGRRARRRGPPGRRGRRLVRHDIAMVGDDIRTDVLAAQRVGLRGVFVLSGKHGRADIEAVAAARGGRTPDGIAPTLLDVVRALG